MTDNHKYFVRNAFTVDVEEYFQVEAFSDSIGKKDWDKYPSRVEKQTNRLLNLLDSFQVRGTFFILGWVAERNPGLVTAIHQGGHEIASHGYDHTMITKMTREEFRKDIRKTKEILEGITHEEIVGYRAPTFSIVEQTSWAYEILFEEGYRYSSSVYPIYHDRYGWPSFGNKPRSMVSEKGRDVWEVPLSVADIGPLKIPFGGGGYLRLYPLLFTKALFRNREKKREPAVIYIHPWELDAQHPKVQAPVLMRLRHYLGIPEMERKLTYLLQWLNFGTAMQFLEEIPERAALQEKGTHQKMKQMER